MTDIVEAAESIHRFLTGVKRETFLQDDLLRSAVLQKLTIIGEAVARLPMEFRDRHPEIQWDDIIGFRNIAVHAYFAVDGWRGRGTGRGDGGGGDVVQYLHFPPVKIEGTSR